jgi:hypothetical protein
MGVEAERGRAASWLARVRTYALEAANAEKQR